MLDILSLIFAAALRASVIMLLFYLLQLGMVLVDVAAGIRKSKRAAI